MSDIIVLHQDAVITILRGAIKLAYGNGKQVASDEMFVECLKLSLAVWSTLMCGSGVLSSRPKPSAKKKGNQNASN